MNETAKKLKPTTLLSEFKRFDHFCKAMLDGYAVIDMTGKVVKSNALFAQLVGMKSRQILKADSFDSMLTLSINDKKLEIGEILQHSSPTRIDEVSGKTATRNDLNLIIGVYPFTADSGEGLGAFVLIRDVTAETNLQGKYKNEASRAITDNLTGLYNRAFFVDYTRTQLKNLETLPEDATQRVISVFMLDIDKFKIVNDTYGHQAGDYVIQKLADIMKHTLRKTDILCRYGGEEFLVILPGADLAGCVRAADKLRQVVEETNFVHEEIEIPITVSCGSAQINVGLETGKGAIQRADEALYFSKENGRNRVSVHNGKDVLPPTEEQLAAG